ncbi:MAG TPA: hypothetical protein VFU22_31995 [Roseiflexaceae bacterium]|nr:hypothetical protein [Roseiflexaceae bacterium]
MQIERLRTTQLRVTLHIAELAALIAAARWVAQGVEGELSAEAIAQLRKVLIKYDAAAEQPAQGGGRWQQEPRPAHPAVSE